MKFEVRGKGVVFYFLPVLVSLVKRTHSERIGTNTNYNLPPLHINAYSSSSKYYIYHRSLVISIKC